MDTKVIYYSPKGNTKKVAEAIAEACGAEAVDIEETHVLGGTDLLFVGAGIYKGKPEKMLMDYLDNLPVNTIKAAAVFSTSRTGRDDTELLVQMLQHKNIEVFPKHLSLKGRRGLFNLHHPDEEDLAKAKRFAYAVLDAYQE